MQYLNPLSLCVLAIAPAIVVAAFAARRTHGNFRTTLLILAATPCLVLAYSTIHALNHHAPRSGGLVGGAISAIGLALVAGAARFGRDLRTGWGLVLLAGMASSPLILLAAAVLYANIPSGGSEVPRRRDLSYPEQLKRSRQLATEDRYRKADAERKTTDLRKCGNELSTASGKIAAKHHYRANKIQFIVVSQFEQESAFEWFPGLSQANVAYYKLENRSATAGVLPPMTTVGESSAEVISPPYQLWSDPWGRQSAYMLSRDINRCNTAILAYATAYNQTMRKLSGLR